MTKTLNQIIFFFFHQNQNIFFSNIGNQNIFLEKNHNPPFKLNGRSLRPDCPLCNSGDEDRKHFIVICSKLMEVCQKFIIALKNILYTSMHHNLCDTIFSDTNTLTQLILDCTALVYIPHSLHISIENISRGLLYALHAARCSFVKDEWIGECIVLGVLLDFTTVKLLA